MSAKQPSALSAVDEAYTTMFRSGQKSIMRIIDTFLRDKKDSDEIVKEIDSFSKSFWEDVE